MIKERTTSLFGVREDFQYNIQSTHEDPLLDKSCSREMAVEKIQAKKIYWKSSLLAAVFWGSANFTFGLIENKDFAVSCLTWTGLIFTSLFYKVFEILYNDGTISFSSFT